VSSRRSTPAPSPPNDILRVLAPGGTPTQLGDALAHYGRIFKTLHVPSYVDDEPYRREIKGMRNLQEGRHDLARTMFHGRKGELRHGYRDGMEDQLGALGLILNTITLWNTVYLDHAIKQLRADGYPVLDADVARLSPYMRRHINFHGHYSFAPTNLGGARRALCDPDAPTRTDETSIASVGRRKQPIPADFRSGHRQHARCAPQFARLLDCAKGSSAHRHRTGLLLLGPKR